MNKVVVEQKINPQTHKDYETSESVSEFIEENIRRDKNDHHYEKEGIEDIAQRSRGVIGRLVQVLADKNLLTEDEILRIAGYGSYNSNHLSIRDDNEE
jgi:hypothetical protein